MKREMAKFKLEGIEPFDARRGYARWVTGGVGTRSSERGSLATVDVWIDREGKLVTRFTSMGYYLHFEIQPVEPNQITPNDREAIEDFLEDKLIQWKAEGVDEDWEG